MNFKDVQQDLRDASADLEAIRTQAKNTTDPNDPINLAWTKALRRFREACQDYVNATG